jgi:hypothetical protein
VYHPPAETNVALSRILIALIVASPVVAQEARPTGLTLGDRFLEVNMGFSWYSPRGDHWGTISNRRVYLSGVRGEWVFAARGPLAWSYLMEWVPLAVVERTSARETVNCHPTPTSQICEVDRSVRVAAGTGASPIGLKLYLNQGRTRRFFASASGGMIAFSSDVPVRGSRRLNFMFDYGGGVDAVLPDGRSATIGYRFHHISNAGSGRVNPGLDANIIYLGLRRKR